MTFIIAEVGSNQKGLKDCLVTIESSKKVGADAVKFQMFSPAELYGPFRSKKPAEGSIEPEWLPKLKKHADACGIELMVSAFSPEGIKTVDPYVRRHKLASCENNHLEMLKLLHDIGKQTIMSCGATWASELSNAIEVIGRKNLILLYCVSAYPAVETKLEKIKALRSEFPDLEVGFSDHSTDYTTIPIEACSASYGAVMLEKHFNPLDLKDTPDAPHSLSYLQFKVMVDRLRLRTLNYNVEVEELSVARQAKRRVIAIKKIKKGDKITQEDVGIFRLERESDQFISPLRIEAVWYTIAKQDFETGDPIQI
jgi:N-acetylneuraminate synthase